MTAVTMTTAGENLVRDAGKGLATFVVSYIAVGTGTTPPTASDTQLVSEVGRYATTVSNGTNQGEAIYSVTLQTTDQAGVTIQEVGFFGGTATSTANTGTLLGRVLYNHAKTNSETLQLTFDLSVATG
jgi:hypothetical protein